jgi:hypothetical protein
VPIFFHLVNPKPHKLPNATIIAVFAPSFEVSSSEIVPPKTRVKLPVSRRKRKLIIMQQPQNLPVNVRLLHNRHPGNQLATKTISLDKLQIVNNFSESALSSVKISQSLIAIYRNQNCVKTVNILWFQLIQQKPVRLNHEMLSLNIVQDLFDLVYSQERFASVKSQHTLRVFSAKPVQRLNGVVYGFGQ